MSSPPEPGVGWGANGENADGGGGLEWNFLLALEGRAYLLPGKGVVLSDVVDACIQKGGPVSALRHVMELPWRDKSRSQESF